MIEPLFETSFTLRAPDVDLYGRMKADALLTRLQEAAGDHANLLGAGFSALRQRGIAWVLSRMALEMDCWPILGQRVTLRTWPGKTRLGLFPRYFMLEDESGAQLGRASSLWVLLDLDQRQMVQPQSCGITVAENLTLTPPMPAPGKIRPLEEAKEQLRQYAPVYGDFDINGHVNNTRYTAWLCDLFPAEWYQHRCIRSLLIHYHNEILPGQPLQLALRQQGDRFTLTGSGDSEFFALSGNWRAV